MANTFKFIHFTPESSARTEPASDLASTSSISNQSSEPKKRGRPLGSKNKQLQQSESSEPSVKRLPGRPPGTGHRQRAMAESDALARKKQVQWQDGEPLKISGSSKSSSQSVYNIFTNANPGSNATPSPPDDPSVDIQETHASSSHSAIKQAHYLANAEPHSTTNSGPTPSPSTTDPMSLINDIGDDLHLESFVAEGLGDDDEDEDEDDGEKPKRRPFPLWFQNLFTRVTSKLETDRKSRKPISKSFWIHREEVWFHLDRRNVKPSDLFQITPEFFVWDPLSLVTAGIACPRCSHPLTRDGIVNRPRRVIDIDSTFWLIGYNYCCRQSSHGCGSKFRSWNPEILKRLPRVLAAEFPAQLTWRSALSNRAFGVVRSCIQRGMGTVGVAEMLRVQHLHRYDQLRLQYLHMKVADMQLLHSDDYIPFPSFDDRSENGFHGFTPSAHWIRDLYDDVMEGHRDTLNQHTAMLSGRVCAIDHSHKIAKHVFKVEGVPIFTALLTVTNEKGEIRVCVFVATKSHAQFIDILRKMSEDLTLYGHTQPEVFYTDNLADKGMLESIFTSLLNDVIAVEKYSHLPTFTLPSSSIITLKTASEINNVIRSILDTVPQSGNLVVGYDSEWNVEISAAGHITGHGPPAVIQIAYETKVYVLQIGEMLAQKRLPHELLNFLRNKQVIKAGKSVNGDLRQLAMAAGCDPSSFQGGLDLATYAKQRLLITDARISLADLTAIILGESLPKNVTERISSSWENQELTDRQLEYAARDAYACLQIYQKINTSPQPTMLPDTQRDSVGLPVIVLTEDSKAIAARGVISNAALSPTHDGIKITPTRTVITVHDILIPATIMTQHKKKSLRDCGSLPFDVVALRSRVRVVPSSQLTPSDSSASQPSQPFQASRDPDSSPDISVPMESLSEDGSTGDGTLLGDILDSIDSESADLDLDQDTNSLSHAAAKSQHNNPNSFDHESAKLGKEALGSCPADPNIFKNTIRSRVVKDVFHMFNMLRISTSHGLRVPFAQTLRDAVLVPHPDDKQRIEAWLATKDLKWDDVVKFKPNWLWRHCRRTIPPPEILYPLVHDIFMTWGPLKDAKSHVPLFTPPLWKVAKNILELIRNGYLSDPPGVPLYYIIGLDKKAGGLPIYRCLRGTNLVEGGVHTHLRSMLPSCGASVRHMITCLRDFILRHNLLVGTYNSTGKKYMGHDSIWLLNEIQELEITLATVHPSSSPIELLWVNGNLYQKTSEEMGVSPIPEHIRNQAGMAEYVDVTDKKQKQSDLAKMQNTRYPVLPVHTVREKKLFGQLMMECEEFRMSTSSIKAAAVKIWNRYADPENDIYYKLEEHLTSYFNGNWKENANIKQSIREALSVTEPLQKRLRNPERANEQVNANTTPMSRHKAERGFQAHPSPTEEPSVAVQNVASSNNLSLPAAENTISLSKKRVAEAAPEAASKRSRQERTCPRCTREDCKGKGSWYFCQHNCRDCGQRSIIDCVGRSSGARNKPRCMPSSSLKLTQRAQQFIEKISSGQEIQMNEESFVLE
ncbi:hypothetical protein H0H93_003468 [Arthromyces matolae]|nr:hypothetical protein H0H93_003468 [Arthromyces matolae]